MKFHILHQIQMAGIVLKSHSTAGSIQTLGASTSISGNNFVKFKNQADVYSKYVGVKPDSFKSLIVIFNNDNTTDIFIDELLLDITNHCIATAKGRTRLAIKGLDIPDDAGILIYLTYREHQIVMFDVTPVANKSIELSTGKKTERKRLGDYELILGGLLDEIDFHLVYSMSEQEWSMVIDMGWFPFAFIQGTLWYELIEQIKSGFELTAFIKKVSTVIKETWKDRIDLWRLSPLVKKEIEFMESAFKCFEDENWIGVSSILEPRMEGMMTAAIGHFAKHHKLVKEFELVVSQKDADNKTLFINHFVDYMTQIVYRSGNMMNPASLKSGLNRHLLGHGRVDSASLDETAAVIRFLTVDHLSRFTEI